MQHYIGTKLVKAVPMTRQAYNEYRKWKLPEGENGGDEGYLIEYTEKGSTPNHPMHRGYISWSPKSIFEQSYRLISGLSFGDAVQGLKAGAKLSRAGWNGKGMYIYLVGAGRYAPSTPAGQAIADGWSDGLVPYRPYIAMFTVDRDVVPWVASQTDILAEDWEVIL